MAVRAILGAFILLSIGYSVLNPVFEAPDEVYHYPYVKHIADGRGLPVQRIDQKEFWEQEGSQPPLYYLLAAALTSWIDTDDLPEVRYLNPHAQIGIALAEDNKNMVVHGDQEKLPWRGSVLAVHIIRLFSVLAGAGTVWCTYRLALKAFPDRPSVALGAMTLNAFNPMYVFVSASVNNDNLVILLASITLLMLVHIVQQGVSTRRLLLLGLVIGLGCLSKLSALGLIPLTGLALALTQIRNARQEARSWWHTAGQWAWDCLLVVVPVLLVAGWWYLRNWRLYGDPLGLNIMLDVFGRRSSKPAVLDLLAEFEGFRISFWGLFGVVNVLLRPHWLYKILDALTAFAVLGSVLWAVRAWRKRRRAPWLILSLLAAWIAIICVSLIRWTVMTKASQGRLIFPAISAISLFMALGIHAWFPARLSRWVNVGLALSLMLLTITAPFVAILPAYARPPIITADDIPASAHPFNVTYGNAVRLLAFQIDRTTVQPGDSLAVTLYWQALQPVDEDLSTYVHLFGWRGQRLGQRDSHAGGGTYPTSRWSPEQVICDTLLLPVREDAAGPVAAELEVGLYRLRNMERLPAVDEQGQSVGRPILARIKIDVPTRPLLSAHALDANLDNRAHLIGYDLSAPVVHSGDIVSLTLHWQVTGKMDRDYTVFVHLVDEQGSIVAQGDGPPMENAYPTSFWGIGEYLADDHQIIVPTDAKPGGGRILVGLYDPSTGARLPILGAGGQTTGDAVLLTAVTISLR